MNRKELESYQGLFRRFILESNTVIWGKITMLDNQTVTIITSRNSIERVPIRIIKGVA